MAVTNEMWVVEGVEGKTRREQKQRLSEWRAKFLAEGATRVDVWEGGYGEYNGAWLFCIIYDSAEAYGKMQDSYSANPDSFDNSMEAWQKTPVLKFRSGGLMHFADDLATFS